MATGIDEDELEEYPAGLAKEPPPLTPVGPDKTAATQQERKLADLHRTQKRRFDLLMGALVVFLLVLFLATLAFMLFMRPVPDVPFTPVTHRVPTTGKETPVQADNNTYTNHTGILDSLHYDYQAAPPTGIENASLVKLFCSTALCQAVVRVLEDEMDPNHDPCNNLYDYVCSKWQKDHEAQAKENGKLSVDDVFSDNYMDMLTTLLVDNTIEPSEWTGILQDCVNGRFVLERDVTEIIEGIPSTGNISIERVAKSIAEMAFLGVSPFFDVVSNASNGTVYIALLPPSFDDDSVSSYNAEMRGLLTSKSDSGEKSAFFDALERYLCFEINRVVTSVNNCSLAPTSTITPPWNYLWYETTGLQHLSKLAASELQLFSALPKAHAFSANDNHRFSSDTEKTIRRLRPCIRFIDRHDSSALRRLVARSTQPPLEQGAKETLRILKESLDDTFPNASKISFALGQAPATENETCTAVYESYMRTDEGTRSGSMLKRLLHATTWSQWISHRGKRSEALSTLSSFAKTSSTVYVPLPVFNSTFTQDPWLRPLSLARVGPRTLKTVFKEFLAPELHKSRLSQCISNRKRSRRSAAGTFTADIDVEEAATFYVALRAYRRQVGEAMAISGSLLNSDSLFLLYYVFNHCEAVSDGREANSDEQSRGRRRRRLVDSITASFSSVLFEQCQTPLDHLSCDFEIDSSPMAQAR